MKTLYDVQQFLKLYGIYIYLGKRLYDIELMEIELKTLHQAGLVEEKVFRVALLILRHEHRLEQEREGREETLEYVDTKRNFTIDFASHLGTNSFPEITN